MIARTSLYRERVTLREKFSSNIFYYELTSHLLDDGVIKKLHALFIHLLCTRVSMFITKNDEAKQRVDVDRNVIGTFAVYLFMQ